MKYCYLLSRSSKDLLCISPFSDPLKVLDWQEDEALTVYSATTLTQDEKDVLYTTLYKEIDRGVDRWVQDTRYLPRLFLGGLVFLLTYFIFSLAVRDPLPMIDELLIAGAATVIAVNVMSRRDRKSSLALKQRLTLKNRVGEAVYDLDDELKCVEHYLYELSQVDPIDLAESISQDEITFPCSLKEGNLVEFAHLYLTWVKYNRKQFLPLLRALERINHDSARQNSFSARLLKLSMNGTLDLPMFALAHVLSK
ncbi:MAG: hypothetical protein JXK93_04160 [Sphaerochaetaceae bacterium]|nr:hypothetical protein [Sphaerochaetaceae bacterium]